MAISLRSALRELLLDWHTDLPGEWQKVLSGAEPAFHDVGGELELYPWEPIFPSRRGFTLPGEPPGAHIFQAFDDLAPGKVRCVVIGQDPYPSISFSTGRAFEVGEHSSWNELEKMKSCSMRSLIQSVYAFRTGEQRYVEGTGRWTEVLEAICDPLNGFPLPKQLAQNWVEQGVLLLNSSLTISRFSVQGDPHQIRGHLPLWRPLLVQLINYFANCPSQPVVFILFGSAAQEVAVASGLVTADELDRHPTVVSLSHPAAGDDFLRYPNPFVLCNEKLLAMKAKPVQW